MTDGWEVDAEAEGVAVRAASLAGAAPCAAAVGVVVGVDTSAAAGPACPAAAAAAAAACCARLIARAANMSIVPVADVPSAGLEENRFSGSHPERTCCSEASLLA